MTKESVGILLTSRRAYSSWFIPPKSCKNTCSDIDIQYCVYQGWGSVSSRLGLCFIKVGVVFHQGWGCVSSRLGLPQPQKK